MIRVFEYNPDQVRINIGDMCIGGGIHTGTHVDKNGHFSEKLNSYGWSSLCMGDEEDIDKLTHIIQPIIYMITCEFGKAPSVNLIRCMVLKLMEHLELVPISLR